MASLHVFELTSDGFLVVRVAPECTDLVRPWLPLNAREVAASPGSGSDAIPSADRMPGRMGHAPVDAHRAVIDVVPSAGTWAGERTDEPDSASRPAVIGSVTCHVTRRRATLAGSGVRGLIDLAAQMSRIEIDLHAAEIDILGAMNLAAALLLAHAHRYLMHCAAVVQPGRGAWILAGDTHSGKTTTSLNLGRAGWKVLSDDHVVLFRRDRAWYVEGWPRMMHVDEGLAAGSPTGVREARHPADFRVHASLVAQLHGVVIPRVVQAAETDNLATMAEPASSADALSMLLRQTAWSLTDPETAPAALADLADAANRPAFHLFLARDTFANPALLASLFS